MQLICTALGVGDLRASTFAAPGQEPENPCTWGPPMLLLCTLQAEGLLGLKSWDFPSLPSGSLMLIVTPGQGKVAGTQVSKEPAIYLLHKETNPVERFHIFSP